LCYCSDGVLLGDVEGPQRVVRGVDEVRVPIAGSAVGNVRGATRGKKHSSVCKVTVKQYPFREDYQQVSTTDFEHIG